MLFMFFQEVETERLSLIFLDASSREDNARFADFFIADGQDYQNYMFGETFYDGLESAEVADIFSETKYLDDLIGRGEKSDYLCITLKGSKEIVGIVHFYRDDHDRSRLSYFVLPPHRRKGIVSEAYNEAARQLENGGVFPSYAEVKISNTASLNFLRKRGFKVAKSVSRLDTLNHSSPSMRGHDLFCLKRG